MRLDSPTQSNALKNNDFWDFLRFLGLLDGPLDGLECSERAENIINRKNIFFYIEAIPFFFSTPTKNILSSSIKIYF